MKNKTALELIILALIVFLGYIFAFSHVREPIKSGDKKYLISEIDLTQVQSIAMSKGDDTVTIALKDNQWTVVERGGYPADVMMVNELLVSMNQLKIIRKPVVGESQYKRLRLLTEGDEDQLGTSLVIKGKSGETFVNTVVGVKHFSKSKDGVYVQGGLRATGAYLLAKETDPFVALVDHPLNSVVTDPVEWLDKSFFRMNSLHSIEVIYKNAEDNWKIAVDDKTNKMGLVGLKSNEVAKGSAINKVAPFFEDLSFIDVVVGSFYIAQMRPVAEIKLTDNKENLFVVRVGNQIGNDYICQILNLYSAQTPESEQTNLRYSSWKYLIPEKYIKPFLQKRGELVVDKKRVTDDKTLTKENK